MLASSYKPILKSVHPAQPTDPYVPKAIPPDMLNIDSPCVQDLYALAQYKDLSDRKRVLAVYMQGEEAEASSASCCIAHAEQTLQFKAVRARYFQKREPAQAVGRSLSEEDQLQQPATVYGPKASEALDLVVTAFEKGQSKDAAKSAFLESVQAMASDPAFKHEILLQAHNLVQRCEERLEHLPKGAQFNVRTYNRYRAESPLWTQEREDIYQEQMANRIPDALVQRFRLNRVHSKLVGFDANQKTLSAMRAALNLLEQELLLD